jgi:hypothetical protein
LNIKTTQISTEYRWSQLMFSPMTSLAEDSSVNWLHKYWSSTCKSLNSALKEKLWFE